MNKIVIHIFYLFLIVAFVSCTNNSTSKESKSEEDTTLIEKPLAKQINVQNFFNTLPPATDIYQLIKDIDLKYNIRYLSDPTRYKQYSLEKSKSLNLGIYGADLAISGLFNQSQESILFLKCANHLSKELGISAAFDENIMNRLENNKENRDSTLKIIHQSFLTADKIFTENKRRELSIMMITGAFVEGMYVTGEYALSKNNDTLAMKKIVELYAKQNESLSYLISLLEELSNDKECTYINDKLKLALPLLQKSDISVETFREAHKLFTQLREHFTTVY